MHCLRYARGRLCEPRDAHAGTDRRERGRLARPSGGRNPVGSMDVALGIAGPLGTWHLMMGALHDTVRRLST